MATLKSLDILGLRVRHWKTAFRNSSPIILSSTSLALPMASSTGLSSVISTVSVRYPASEASRRITRRESKRQSTCSAIRKNISWSMWTRVCPLSTSTTR